MPLTDIKRSDALFWAQLLSAVLSAMVSFLALRKFFAERGGLGALALREDLKRYYYAALAIVVLLAVGVILYFKMVSKQIGEADEIDNAQQNPLLDVVDLGNAAMDVMAKCSPMAKSGAIQQNAPNRMAEGVLLVRTKKV